MSVVLHYLGEMGGVMLLALPPWLLLRTLWLLAKKQSPRWGRELLLAALALYLAGLASQTLSTPVRVDLTDLPALWARALQRWQEGLAVNLVPGRTIRAFWQRGSQTQQLVNLAGNVAVFLPLGFLPPLLWRRWRTGGRPWPCRAGCPVSSSSCSSFWAAAWMWTMCFSTYWAGFWAIFYSACCPKS